MPRAMHANGPTLCALTVAASLLLAAPAGAEGPKGHFVVQGETVEDTATKLVWQRAAPAKTYNAIEAGVYCASLNLSGGGWRLPTIKELHTLVDETKLMPAIDRAAFPETPPTLFWTSSRLAKYPQYIWSLNFGEGTDSWFTEEIHQQVRCVR